MNTFGFSQSAERYAEVEDESALLALLEHAERQGWPVFVLGGGSNLVLTRDVPGLVVRYTARGVRYGRPDAAGAVLVTAEAGMGWDALVSETLERGLRGLENLALIPGTVGAAPIQNIGAYGVELAERLVGVRAWHRPSRRWHELASADCAFAYRDSLFKREPDDWLITSVTFELGPHRPLRTDYAALSERLKALGIVAPDELDVREAVTAIRRERLPDPARLGNAGSFFHNPHVSGELAADLRERFPDIVQYPQPDGRVKLAAGWLVDRLGYRGCRRGGVGVHDRQALVLVHHGGGDGRALIELADEIVDAVLSRYGVTLDREPRVI